VPRADLTGPGEWATHAPSRTTGPNAESCNACHSLPFDDGAGGAAANVHRDPLHAGSLHTMIQRNTPHVFAPGALQRLAEEMTADLQGIRERLVRQVAQTGRAATAALAAKGVGFGTLRAARSFSGRVVLDLDRVEGVDDDLVVKPFQWKGSVAFLRDFNRGAAHNELGMQAAELVGDAVDGDADGVAGELSVGDLTALTVYLAAQPRPVTKLELHALGLIPPLPGAEVAAIGRGRTTFGRIGCAVCHVPRLVVDDPVFREPSASAAYRDARFPGRQSPAASGVRPDFPVRFDLTQDQPDNVVFVQGRRVRLGSLQRGADGRIGVELFGDLKRHRMGQALAESIDEVGTGSATFLTENLWGVGSTAPYLHDGRATTLTEAILEHGGEAADSRAAFVVLPPTDQADLIAFLDNLVLFKVPE
jgi:cytochrome c peroxidase